MDLVGRNVAVYNVVDAMCKSQSDVAFYKRISAMTCIIERRAFNERLYVMKSWYVAEVIVLADNFDVCYLISMSIGPLAFWHKATPLIELRPICIPMY